MAINFLLQPQVIAPVYNPIIAAFSASTSATTQAGFNYVVKIKDANTNEILNTKRLPPNPDGVGVFDISRLLQTKVENNINENLLGVAKNTKNNFEYKLEYGSESFAEWQFQGIANINGKLALGNTGSTPWNVGDYIAVKNNIIYDGIYQVISATTVFGANYLITNKSFISFAYPSGSTFNANGNKTYVSGSTSSNYIAFNSALTLNNWRNYTPITYELTQANQGKFLTSLPHNADLNTMYQIELDQQCVVGGYAPLLVQAPDIIIKTYTKNNTLIGSYKIAGISEKNFLTFGVGTRNIANASSTTIIGPPTIFNDDVDWYKVYTINSSGYTTSVDLNFKIKKECSKHEKVNIVFCDSFGSYIPFSFNYGSKRTININRKNVSRLIGKFNTNTNQYSIQSTEREKSVIASTYSETVTVNSGWITDNESEYLKQLFISNDAYILDEHGIWTAINITNTSYEPKTTAKERLINIQLTYTYAVSESAQASI